MATYLALLILVTTFLASANAANENSRNKDFLIAIREMQTATYFSFVMLMNMYPPERIPGNVTFLMPNDRMLSEISLTQDTVYKFLLRHSIPSPLLFDHLERFPTGSMIPTSEPDFMLKIFNKGRRNFYLNNVQIISPNICMAGSSIRCHGIKGVLAPVEQAHNTTFSSPTCSPPSLNTPVRPASPKTPAAPGNSKNTTASAHPTFQSPTLPPTTPESQIPITAPPPINLNIRPKKSDSSQLVAQGMLHFIIHCMILGLVTFQI
ncbi:hypothetical protein AQUCO_00500579v1 [Aquilegia coerulea]|uniref:FAS1 domain-containing protein n=1 Tax=Aquilegia coerulea TaxID=218851 RepID=A0A2G5ESM5_AQUCA|nr:hypothetical protein AQUCO_00500579v1 [Aquilegia coerulea]